MFVMQALAYPKRMSLELLKHLLTVLSKCLYLATDHFTQNFQQVRTRSHTQLAKCCVL